MTRRLRSTVSSITIVSLVTLLAHGAEPTYEVIHHPNPDPPKGASLGHSVATLDWNADGVLDVAGGAPGENRTYVFLGPDFVQYEVVSVDGLAKDDRFGYQITAGDLDDTAGDELVIAAPKAKVGDTEKAGAVWVYGRGDKGVRKLISNEPREDGMFGNDVVVGDFNADGRLDVAASSPGLTGGLNTGTTSVFFNVKGMLDDDREVVLRNHQKEGLANFGHDLAVGDWNADGQDDLCVGAIWNTNTQGVAGGGQLILYVGPIGDDGESSGRRVFEDNLTSPNDQIVRWGMSIDARDQTILVGSPRKDVLPVLDAGMGFAFRPGETVRNYSPKPVENGILGYRARAVDLIGDATPDIAFMSLPVGTYVWDGAHADGDPVFFARPPAASSHWCSGAVAAQIVPGGKEELVLGSPRWSPPGKPKSWKSGRLMIMQVR
jgi:hypothetical protein